MNGWQAHIMTDKEKIQVQANNEKIFEETSKLKKQACYTTAHHKLDVKLSLERCSKETKLIDPSLEAMLPKY